jgi:hypothetical protein
MNNFFMEMEYKKCFDIKYKELCQNQISNDKQEHNNCINLDINNKIRTNADNFCKDKVKIFQYPRFK